LQFLRGIADKYRCTIAQLCCAWVLHQPAVASVIVGLRAGLSEHIQENKAMMSIVMKPEDVAQIRDYVLANSKQLPNDCGDEYR
jgi:aryl-alcohol dehydrogenase-like predicted oxidoreductase